MIIFKIANVILPVFIVMSIGFLVGRLLDPDTKAPSNLTLYIFSPALFFNSLINSKLETWELGKIVLFALAVFLTFSLLVYGLATLLSYDRENKNALLLASAFPNSGNYALPLILFAFGDAGVAVGVIFMSIQNIIINSAGVFFASQAQQGMKEALLNIIRVPGFIAVLLGLILRLLQVQLPEILARPVGLLGDAAIPTILVLLGITLSKVKIKGGALKFLGLAAGLKLVVYPLAAFLLISLFFPLNSLEAKVLLLSTATPTAATITIIAIKFNAKPELVSTAMFITTVLSLLTVSGVLAFIL